MKEKHQKDNTDVDLASTNDIWCYVAPRGYGVGGERL